MTDLKFRVILAWNYTGERRTHTVWVKDDGRPFADKMEEAETVAEDQCPGYCALKYETTLHPDD